MFLQYSTYKREEKSGNELRIMNIENWFQYPLQEYCDFTISITYIKQGKTVISLPYLLVPVVTLE